MLLLMLLIAALAVFLYPIFARHHGWLSASLPLPRRRPALAFAAALLTVPMLTACETIPASPGSAADTTVLDEQAAYGVELAYAAARTAAEVGVKAGFIKGETAVKVASADQKAYAAVLLARAAYDTGNADTYETALIDARAAIAALLTLANGDPA